MVPHLTQLFEFCFIKQSLLSGTVLWFTVGSSLSRFLNQRITYYLQQHGDTFNGSEQWRMCIQAVCTGVLHVMVTRVGFFGGLTAHETTLLIFAALMVVSFTPDEWTLKNKLSQDNALTQFKWNSAVWTKSLSCPWNEQTIVRHNNCMRLKVQICHRNTG